MISNISRIAHGGNVIEAQIDCFGFGKLPMPVQISAEQIK